MVSAQRKMPRFDFSQNFIKAGYKEMAIPANPAGTGNDRWRLNKNALHLWPRGTLNADRALCHIDELMIVTD